MNIDELNELSYELGSEKLADLGFKFDNGSWHFRNNEFQLSFMMTKDENGVLYDVSFLTIGLIRFALGTPESYLPGKDINKIAQLQISPTKLAQYCSGGLKDEHWHYVNAFTRGWPAHVYYPLYYGGKKQAGLVDKLLGREIEQKYSEKTIRGFGAELITERETKVDLADCLDVLAQYGMKWAAFMTSEEILRQISQYGKNTVEEQAWLNASRVSAA